MLILLISDKYFRILVDEVVEWGSGNGIIQAFPWPVLVAGATLERGEMYEKSIAPSGGWF